MKRPTIGIIQGSASDVIEAKLGDMFFINSDLKALNSNEFCEFRVVVSIIIAIRQHDKRVWLFSACVDRSQYAISKVDKNKISLLSGKKETTFSINDIKSLLLTKAFHTKELGIRMYGLTISTNPKLMSQMDMIKINARMPDVSKWPTKAIDMWAKCQYNLKSQELLKIVKEVGGDDNNKFTNLILLTGIIKKKWHSLQVKKGEDKTQSILSKIATIIQHLQTMRVWRSLNTRFIKIHHGEMVSGSVRFKDAFDSKNLFYYSVLVIGDSASYILIRPDEKYDTEMNFKFFNGTYTNCKMVIFNTDKFKWALKRLDEDERNNCSISIPIIHPITQNELVDASPAIPDLRIDPPPLDYANSMGFPATTNNVTFSTTDLIVNTIDVTEFGQEPTEVEEPEIVAAVREHQENYEE